MDGEINTSLAGTESEELAMPIDDEKLDEGIGRTRRHFGSWREKAFVGYFDGIGSPGDRVLPEQKSSCPRCDLCGCHRGIGSVIGSLTFEIFNS